jgi:hypothetical protein
MATPTPPVHLEWVAPAGCPSHGEILEAIERTVGAGARGGAVDARVIVTAGERELRAELTVSASGATSTRSLTGESCRAIADAATLVIALAANPDAVPLASPPAPPPPAPPTSAAAPPPVPRRAVFVEASFLVDSAILPAAGLGGELAVGWSPAHFALEITGAFVGPERATLASAPSQGASLWLGHLGARACYELFDARIDVGPCLGGGVEWTPARGFGTTPDQPANATGQMGVGSLGGRAIVRASSRVALRLVGEAVVPLTRPTFVIDGGGQVFQTPAASFRATAGVEVHF